MAKMRLLNRFLRAGVHLVVQAPVVHYLLKLYKIHYISTDSNFPQLGKTRVLNKRDGQEVHILKMTRVYHMSLLS